MSAPTPSPPAALSRGQSLIVLDPALHVAAAHGPGGAPLPTGAPFSAWLPEWRPVAGTQRVGALEVDALALADGGWALATRPRGRPGGIAAAVADPLIGVVLHELNNALTVIFGQAELGARDAPPAQARALGKVRTAADRLRELAAAVVRLRSPAARRPGSPALAADLHALLGPHRTFEPPLEPAQLDGLEPLEVAAIGAALRTLPPTAWRVEGAASQPSGLRLTRAVSAPTPPDPPVVDALAAAIQARGGAWSATPGGWQLRLRAPSPRQTLLVWVQEPDLADLLREALADIEIAEARSVDELDALLTAPNPTLLVDAAALRRGLSAAWPALLLRSPRLRLIVLHANLAELPRGATGLSGPLDLAALRSALGT